MKIRWNLLILLSMLTLLATTTHASTEQDLVTDDWAASEDAVKDHSADSDASRAPVVGRRLLSTPHRALHRAAAVHAVARRAALRVAARGRPIQLPRMPSSPPVCSQPPPMRFCHNVRYPVYRPSADHTFAQLDFDSHAVYKKIVPHMRISERHFELPVIEGCRSAFREFLCLRNFPRCCHIGLCSQYGAPEPALTTATLRREAARKLRHSGPTKVTFVHGSKDTMKVEAGLNDTVTVKVANAVCLQYVQTYTPLFDCRTHCRRLLSRDCRFMLDQSCDNLCYGVHSEVCATRALYQIATGTGSPATPASRPAPALALAAAALAAAAAAAAAAHRR